MVDEFTIKRVGEEVLNHLERRRPEIVDDLNRVRVEVREALAPIRQSYTSLELPPAYFAALERELVSVVPARWRDAALAYTALERRRFGLWRGADVTARFTYVLIGLFFGAFLVAAPFIPIWEKWIPLALGVAAWWIPDLQVALHRRRYGKALGDILAVLGGAQPALERAATLNELAPPDDEPPDDGKVIRLPPPRKPN